MLLIFGNVAKQLPLITGSTELCRVTARIDALSCREGGGVVAQPILQIGMRFELCHLDAIHSWACLADTLDVIFGHFPDPNDTMALKPT